MASGTAVDDIEKPDTAARTSVQEDLSGQDDISRIVKENLNALTASKNGTNERAQNLCASSLRPGGRVGGAEGAADINRTTLYVRLRKFGIDPRQFS
jgi:transcriptional regulator of acetoin/glycerol metabolism